MEGTFYEVVWFNEHGAINGEVEHPKTFEEAQQVAISLAMKTKKPHYIMKAVCKVYPADVKIKELK